MPNSGVLDAVRGILEASPRSAILLFTGDARHPDVRAALAAGAIGLVAKDTTPADLRAAIRDAAAGELVSADERMGSATHTLTPRELDVLHCVATGMTNVQIAAQLGLQATTVKAYWEEAM